MLGRVLGRERGEVEYKCQRDEREEKRRGRERREVESTRVRGMSAKRDGVDEWRVQVSEG